jgi:hypothetical protein
MERATLRLKIFLAYSAFFSGPKFLQKLSFNP